MRLWRGDTEIPYWYLGEIKAEEAHFSLRLVLYLTTSSPTHTTSTTYTSKCG